MLDKPSDMPSDKRPHKVHGHGRRHLPEGKGGRLKGGRNHDDCGIYVITIFTANRRQLLGSLRGTTRSEGPAPHLELSPIGRRIQEVEIPAITQRYPSVEVLEACLMPDYIHLILHVKAPLPNGKRLGNVIGSFKICCLKAWMSLAPSTRRSKSSRPTANAKRPALFERGYGSRTLKRDEQLEIWKDYIIQSPYRKIFQKEHPYIMKNTHCVEIGGVNYGAFGNMFLMHYPERHKVFFERLTTEDGISKFTQDSRFWLEEYHRLISLADLGDVLVTTANTECEKRIKNHLLRHKRRLILLEDSPIGQFWKPERHLLEACERGNLLILAPWDEDVETWAESEPSPITSMADLASFLCSTKPEIRRKKVKATRKKESRKEVAKGRKEVANKRK